MVLNMKMAYTDQQFDRLQSLLWKHRNYMLFPQEISELEELIAIEQPSIVNIDMSTDELVALGLTIVGAYTLTKIIKESM
jgi:hypothetical protein